MDEKPGLSGCEIAADRGPSLPKACRQSYAGCQFCGRPGGRSNRLHCLLPFVRDNGGMSEAGNSLTRHHPSAVARYLKSRIAFRLGKGLAARATFSVVLLLAV